ncbi:MAG: hypothetical protein JOS17DRAFT_756275 [Linnemannia elongata]|nr:MAG: hypothetical protein JOS17DRAFT_756275 [Linnemannia elongata]
MLRSAASFIVLSLVAIQAAVASTITPGVYLIQDVRSRLFLGIGPVPPSFPLRDVPVQLVSEDAAFNYPWFVKEGTDGGIIIAARDGGPNDYKITYEGPEVIASARKAPQTWEAAQVGGGPFEVAIKLPYDNRVITADLNVFPQVTLQPSVGENNQRFRFYPIRPQLYHRNRFTVQDTC